MNYNTREKLIKWIDYVSDRIDESAPDDYSFYEVKKLADDLRNQLLSDETIL